MTKNETTLQVRTCVFRGHEIHLASFVEAFRLLKLFNSRESNSLPPPRGTLTPPTPDTPTPGERVTLVYYIANTDVLRLQFESCRKFYIMSQLREIDIFNTRLILV